MANSNNDNGDAPQDELEQAIQQIAEITGVDEAFAHFMLQENDYDLNRALTNFFNEQQYEEQQQQNKSVFGDESSQNDISGIEPTEFKAPDDDKDTKNDQPTGIEEPAKKRLRPSPSQIDEEFPDELVLVSWNIDGLEEAHRKKRFTAVLYLIAKINPEVVFLQEMIPNLMAQLRELMAPMYNIFIQEPHIEYFCVTLVSKNIKIINDQSITYSNTKMGRGMLIVEAKWQRLNLKLLNTHLESMKEFEKARQEQFSQCIERLIFMTAYNPVDTLAIIGGDLNIRDKEICPLPVAVKDAWVAAGSNEQFCYTWDMRRNDNYEGRFGKAKPRCRFDRIYFAGPNCKSVDFQLEGISRIKDTNCFPSDHFAIVCRFALNKNKTMDNEEKEENTEEKEEFDQFGAGTFFEGRKEQQKEA